MSTGLLLSRLDEVRRTGPGRWSARCPAHADKSPSLSVRELDDGRVLVHDFGGCSVHDVLASVGLDMTALFPEKRAPGAGAKRERKPWSSFDLLRLASFEAHIVALITSDMLAGREADRPRLLEAVRRLSDIVEAVDAR